MFGDDNGFGSNDLGPLEVAAAVYVASELLSTPSYITSSEKKKEEEPKSGVTVVCVPQMTAEEEASLKAFGWLMATLVVAVVVGICWLALR